MNEVAPIEPCIGNIPLHTQQPHVGLYRKACLAVLASFIVCVSLCTRWAQAQNTSSISIGGIKADRLYKLPAKRSTVHP